MRIVMSSCRQIGKVLLAAALSVPALGASAQSSDSLVKLLDTILIATKKQSYYSNNVSWPKLEKEVRDKARGAATIRDMDSAFYHLLSSLGDFHGAVYYKSGGVEYRVPSGRKPYATQDSIRSLIRQGRLGLATAVVRKDIGYIRIPSIGAVGDEKIIKAATAIRDSICRLPFSAMKGWIIDLRFNGGGNIYAMAAGLSGFLAEEQQLDFVDANGKAAYSMRMEGMNLSSGDFKPTAFTENCYTIARGTPVVILVSRHTGSSGEGLAMLLRKGGAAVIIGEETDGYATSTNYIDIMKMAALNITTAYPLDAHGKTYTAIQPDIVLEPAFDPGDILKDTYMESAIRWVDEKAGRR